MEKRTKLTWKNKDVWQFCEISFPLVLLQLSSFSSLPLISFTLSIISFSNSITYLISLSFSLSILLYPCLFIYLFRFLCLCFFFISLCWGGLSFSLWNRSNFMAHQIGVNMLLIENTTVEGWLLWCVQSDSLTLTDCQSKDFGGPHGTIVFCTPLCCFCVAVTELPLSSRLFAFIMITYNISEPMVPEDL